MSLQEWFDKTGMKYYVFAKKMGICRSTLYFWLKGKTLPSYKNYLKIKELTNDEVTIV